MLVAGPGSRGWSGPLRGCKVRPDQQMGSMPSELRQAPTTPASSQPGRAWGRLPTRAAREQFKEVGILLVLTVVRIHMLNYVDALDSSKSDKTYAIKSALKGIALNAKDLSLYIPSIMIALLVLVALLGRRIPRRWLDVVAGSFIGINLIFHFIKINLLLLTPPAAPSMLLGQILTYLIFFVFSWGWIFWRFDWVGKDQPGTVIEITDKGDFLSAFDYYHASLMALVRRGRPEVAGINRTGRILVSIHTFMILDLIGIALGRFYQLITTVI